MLGSEGEAILNTGREREIGRSRTQENNDPTDLVKHFMKNHLPQSQCPEPDTTGPSRPAYIAAFALAVSALAVLFSIAISQILLGVAIAAFVVAYFVARPRLAWQIGRAHV